MPFDEKLPMADTIVDRLHSEFSELLTVLDQAQEISLRSTADDNFRKSLLLSAASYFERRITDTVLNLVSDASGRHPLVTAFVQNKAVSRQYHKWFVWEQRNANSFFGLFGDAFLSFMKSKVRDEEVLAESIRAFLELGAERNRLVHQDFGTFSLEKTSLEIYLLYKRALRFVDEFPSLLGKFSETHGDA